jgi:outer membrane protein
MIRRLFVVFALMSAFPASAGGIAVVDFQRAVNETDEGKAAQGRLDAMYGSRKSEIERLQKELETEIKDYQARSMILSEDARVEAEQALMIKQQRFEATYGQYQQEMQQTYYSLLQDLDQKMRAMSAAIAKEKQFDLVVDKAMVIYTGGTTDDMTDELIRRYNAK